MASEYAMFGVGSLFATDASTGITTKFGTLQGLSVDFSYDMKELYGSKQFAVATARGKGKVECKSTYGQLSPQCLAQFFNVRATTGEELISDTVNATIPSATPYTITITAPTSGTLTGLVTVYNVSGSTPVAMTAVTGTPTTGEYSYSAGVITFAAADEGIAIQYQYKYTLTTGNTITIVNSLMGTAPTFSMDFTSKLDSHNITISLPKCTSSKLGLAFKNEDFVIPDFSFQALATAADVVGYIYMDA